MVLDDLILLAKMGKRVDPSDITAAMRIAGRSIREIDAATQGYRLVKDEGKLYKVDWWLTDDEAARVIWNNVKKPKSRGEEAIELPSELPKERQAVIEEESPKSNVIPFPKKLDPGIYVDEESGKYFKIDKDGNMEPIDEAP